MIYSVETPSGEPNTWRHRRLLPDLVEANLLRDAFLVNGERATVSELSEHEVCELVNDLLDLSAARVTRVNETPTFEGIVIATADPSGLLHVALKRDVRLSDTPILAIQPGAVSLAVGNRVEVKLTFDSDDRIASAALA